MSSPPSEISISYKARLELEKKRSKEELKRKEEMIGSKQTFQLSTALLPAHPVRLDTPVTVKTLKSEPIDIVNDNNFDSCCSGTKSTTQEETKVFDMVNEKDKMFSKSMNHGNPNAEITFSDVIEIEENLKPPKESLILDYPDLPTTPPNLSSDNTGASSLESIFEESNAHRIKKERIEAQESKGKVNFTIKTKNITLLKEIPETPDKIIKTENVKMETKDCGNVSSNSLKSENCDISKSNETTKIKTDSNEDSEVEIILEGKVKKEPICVDLDTDVDDVEQHTAFQQEANGDPLPNASDGCQNILPESQNYGVEHSNAPHPSTISDNESSPRSEEPFLPTDCNQNLKVSERSAEDHILLLNIRDNDKSRKQIPVQKEDIYSVIKTLEDMVSKHAYEEPYFEPVTATASAQKKYFINDKNYRQTFKNFINERQSSNCFNFRPGTTQMNVQQPFSACIPESHLKSMSLASTKDNESLVSVPSEPEGLKRKENLINSDLKASNISAPLNIHAERAPVHNPQNLTDQSFQNNNVYVKTEPELNEITLGESKHSGTSSDSRPESQEKFMSLSSESVGLKKEENLINIPAERAPVHSLQNLPNQSFRNNNDLVKTEPELNEIILEKSKHSLTSSDSRPESREKFMSLSSEPIGSKREENVMMSDPEASNVSSPFNFPSEAAPVSTFQDITSESLLKILDSVKAANASSETTAPKTLSHSEAPSNRPSNGGNERQECVQMEPSYTTFQQNLNVGETISATIDLFLNSRRNMSSAPPSSIAAELQTNSKRTSVQSFGENSRDPRMKRKRSQSSNEERSPNISNTSNTANSSHRQKFFSSPPFQDSPEHYISITAHDSIEECGPHSVSSEAFIKIICDWNVSCFLANPSCSPPNVEVLDIKKYYSSYTEYYKTYSALLILEVWQKLLKSMTYVQNTKFTENTFKIRKVKGNIIECERLIVKSKDYQYKENYLVVATFTCSHNKTSNSLVNQIKMLGLIRKSEQRDFSSEFDGNQPSLAEYEKLPVKSLKKIKLNLFVSCPTMELGAEKYVTIQPVFSVQNFIQQYDALLHLPKSELSSAILCPDKDNARDVNFFSFSSTNSDDIKEKAEEIGNYCALPHDKKLILVQVPQSTIIQVLCAIINEIKVLSKFPALVCVESDENLKPLYYALVPENKAIVIPLSATDEHRKTFFDDLVDISEFAKANNRERCFPKLKQCNVLLTVVHSSVLRHFDDLRINCCIINNAHRFKETELLASLKCNTNKLMLLGVLKRQHPYRPITSSSNPSVFHRAFGLV